MKHIGCVLDFTDERNDELMRVFREIISKMDFIEIEKVSEILVNTPCKRFWVSEHRTMVVITSLQKGKDVLKTMRPTKREMFKEIYDRVTELQKKQPDKPLFELVVKVVNSPAPKFYIKPRCAMDIIYKIKNGFYKKQIRRD